MRAMLVLLAACKGAGPTAGGPDADGDGFPVEEDCNDDDAAVYPGAPERCDDIDQDCDGAIDDPLAVHVEGGPTATDLADALTLAQVDQTIVLCPGTHAGAVVRDRVLRGRGEGVILDAGGQGSAVQAQGRVELYGLTLTGGAGSPGPLGGAVGGGINATEATSLVVADVTVEDNRADHGGGIAVGSGTTSLERVVLRSNEATSGGGLHVTDGTVTCAETVIEGNTADAGGGLRMVDGTVSGCTIQDNAVVDNGGGVYLSGDAELRNSTVSDNTAVGFGGGIYVLPGATVLVQGSTIADNTAEAGAGLFVNPHAEVALTASTVRGNTATSEGGGLYLWNAEIDGGTVRGNHATQNGGGIAVFEAGVVSGARVEENDAPSGAGISVRDGTAGLSGVQLVGNDAGDYGGGLYVNDATVTVNALVLQQNQAGERGGGVYLSNAVIEGADLFATGNEAEAGGGAYVASTGGTLIGRFESNLAETGAGVASLGPATVDVEVVANEASIRGGGLYVDGADAVVTGSVVAQDNTAVEFGGGVYAQAASNLTLNASVTGNLAPLGAGIYVNGGSVVTLLADSQVSSNGDLDNPGGGVRINEGTLVVEESFFATNVPDDVFTVGNGNGTVLGGPVSVTCTQAGCP